MNKYHREIIELIRQHAGKPTQHTFSDNYLGNNHPRYPINVPTLRKLGKGWMQAHHELGHAELSKLLTSLVQGESSTEKCMAGILLDYTVDGQRKFKPEIFEKWLDHLEGWAEIDAVCTSKYTSTHLATQWVVWKPLLIKFSTSKNISKRRASIVLVCSTLRNLRNDDIVETTLANIDRLKVEKEILITKAISWLLRTIAKHHKQRLKQYLRENSTSLPKIALRETLTKLKTGTKTKRKALNSKSNTTK